MGGQGKTPLVEYIARRFQEQNLKVTILSRGYGRKSRGLRTVKGNEAVRQVGDENMMLFRRLEGKIRIASVTNRAMGIRQLEQDAPQDLYILDDGLQHRSLAPTLSVLVSSYSSPFTGDYLFPMGWLRESRKGARRAHLVVVSKCPAGLTGKDMDRMSEEVHRYQPSAEVYFAKYQAGPPTPLFGSSTPPGNALQRIILVHGVADPTPFRSLFAQKSNILTEHRFRDHHPYSSRDIARLVRSYRDLSAPLVTTEKDAVKLQEFDVLKDIPAYYIPIEVQFLRDEKRFLMAIGAVLSGRVDPRVPGAGKRV